MHLAPPPVGDDGMDGCFPVEETNHYISEYYNIRGSDQMKAELYAHRPISCGITATENYDKNYLGCIYRLG